MSGLPEHKVDHYFVEEKTQIGFSGQLLGGLQTLLLTRNNFILKCYMWSCHLLRY